MSGQVDVRRLTVGGGLVLVREMDERRWLSVIACNLGNPRRAVVEASECILMASGDA